MNRRLALYVDKDFMLAGVKPFDTFTPLTAKGYARIPLYFFVDTAANRIFYGDRYRSDFEDNLPDTYGDFLNTILDEKAQYRVFHYTVPVVELLKVVMDDIRREYLTVLGELTNALDPAARIPVAVSWSDGVGEASRKVFTDYLRRIGYDPEEAVFVPTETLALSLFASNHLTAGVHRKVVVMEAFGDDLHYSLIQCYNAASVERIGAYTYPLLGVDSRVNVIATYTVNYVNTRRRLLQHKEIEQLVTFQVRHVSQSFELFLEREGQRPEDVDKIILLGESLRNSAELRADMSRFGGDKILLSDDRTEYGILDGIFLRKAYQEKPQSAPVAPAMPDLNQTLPPPAATPAGFDSVIISSQLAAGAQLELGWNDRLIRAMFIGNNRFLIVQHFKSQIITGDQFSIDTLLLGQRPVFRNITRNNQPLGDYTPSGVLNVLKKI
jgi:hypothetical protein